MKLSLSRVAEFLSATGEFDHKAVVQGYSIDSRTIQPGELFFAVKGERLDGHDYVSQARDRGAAGAVVRKDQLARYCAKVGLIAVEDTLVALQTLATAARRLWGKPAIAITGSMGKTTTKDALAHLLATRFRVHSSKGNFNNHFGLPLGLLKLEPEHEVAVIEMGMSHAGEITALARIAQPETGVVTGVAPVHLEYFDSLAGIARAKYELIQALPANGVAVLNADDEYVSQFGRDFHGRVITFGIQSPADVRAENVDVRGLDGVFFDLVAHGVRERAACPLIGRHNVYNVLAAAAVALEMGVTPSEVVGTIPSLEAADKRGQVLHFGNTTVINDCYNSSPKALRAAVDVLAATPAKRRLVVAGEMLELGPQAEELHRECGRYIAGKGVSFLLGVRGMAAAMVDAAKKAGLGAEFVDTPEQAGEWLAREGQPGDTVLLKASRGVKLERALEIWQAKPGTGS